MKHLWKKSLLVSLVAASAVAGCGDDITKPEPTPTEGQTVEVTTNITADTTWESTHTYVLKQPVFVESGTLTIQPGTKVLGENGSALVVTRNAKINAVGTQDKPIVFTSSRPVGERYSKDWGGVILLGKAKLNVPDQFIEGFPTGDERLKYGGGGANVGDDTHDCGKLKYVRIEFGGVPSQPDKEINSLTLGGCGSQTEVDYVQTHRGSDDGVEVFGGTANLKHIVVSLAEDDGLDWDFGYRGKVQYLIVQQGPEIGNNGIEADNYVTGNDAQPRSAPEIWNATFIGHATGGPEKSIGMTLRRGTAGTLNNIIVADFADGAIDINGTSSAQQFRDGALAIKNSLFWNLKGSNTALPSETDNDGGLDEAAELMKTNVTNNQFADPKLGNAKSLTAPNFKPQAESAALVASSAAAPMANGFFDTSAKFIGAVGNEDWTAGWTAYPEK